MYKHLMYFFSYLSILCFVISLSIPFHDKSLQDVGGAVIFCSTICSILLLLQLCNSFQNLKPESLFWGQMFILWSILHMTAAFMQIVPFMFGHLLWVFSSVCLQISHIMLNTSNNNDLTLVLTSVV